jgi:dihydropteroate synthase
MPNALSHFPEPYLQPTLLPPTFELLMYTINCKGRLLLLDKPVVMGIINLTPDSFFEGSRSSSIQDAVAQAGKMLEEGATILDIGGQSTRPGAQLIGAEVEQERVVATIKAIVQQFPEAILSIDTFHASVARAAVEAGAAIVNDISGGLLDNAMLPTVAKLQVPYICMHMRGNPTNMQQFAHYHHVVQEVLDYFIERLEACRLAGIQDVVVDPGFGFAKTIQHNFTLLNNLSLFSMLNRPVLVGISRKATIYKTLGITAVEALNGTTVLNTIGLLNGARILRVHDVREAVEVVKLVEQLKTADEAQEKAVH